MTNKNWLDAEDIVQANAKQKRKARKVPATKQNRRKRVLEMITGTE
jgi:hypothetical protein